MTEPPCLVDTHGPWDVVDACLPLCLPPVRRGDRGLGESL